MFLHFFDFNEENVRIHMENAVLQLTIANIKAKHAENNEILCKNAKKERRKYMCLQGEVPKHLTKSKFLTKKRYFSRLLAFRHKMCQNACKLKQFKENCKTKHIKLNRWKH